MTVEWLAEQLKEHNIQLTETQKQQFQKHIIVYLLNGMKR